MGNGIFAEELPGTGTLTQVFANATGMRQKVGGITYDWSKVTAPVSDVILPDGTKILAGKKYLRYGTFHSKITQVEVNTITVDATGGTFKIGVTIRGVTETTAAIVENATQQQVQDALDALYIVQQNGGVTVSTAGSVHTLTFNQQAGNVTVTTDAALLTGGAGTAAVVVTTNGDANAGMYGPYDSTATDGRQNRNRGEIFFINKTVLEDDEMSNHPPAYEGGNVFLARLDLGSAPKLTRAQCDTVFPDLKYTSTAN